MTKSILLITDTDVYSLLGGYRPGNLTDGNAVLLKEGIPETLCQSVLQAGYGFLVEGRQVTDTEICRFMNVPFPQSEQEWKDALPRITQSFEWLEYLYWTHYGTYGTDESVWVIAKREKE